MFTFLIDLFAAVDSARFNLSFLCAPALGYNGDDFSGYADQAKDVNNVLSIVGPRQFLRLHSIVMMYADDKAMRAAYLKYSRIFVEAALTAQRVAIYKATVQRPWFSEVTVNAPARRIPSTIAPDKVRLMVAAFSR